MLSPRRLNIFRSSNRENSVPQVCRDIEQSLREFDKHLSSQRAITNRIEFWASTIDDKTISSNADRLASYLREYWIEEEKLKSSLQQFSEIMRILSCEEDALIKSKAKLDAAERQVELAKLKARQKDPSKTINDHDMIAKSAILHSQVRSATRTTYLRFNSVAQRVLKKAFTELFSDLRKISCTQQDILLNGLSLANQLPLCDENDTIHRMLGRSRSFNDFKRESRKLGFGQHTGINSLLQPQGSAESSENETLSAPVKSGLEEYRRSPYLSPHQQSMLSSSRTAFSSGGQGYTRLVPSEEQLHWSEVADKNWYSGIRRNNGI